MRKLKQLLSIVMCVALVLTAVSVSAFAADGDETSNSFSPVDGVVTIDKVASYTKATVNGSVEGGNNQSYFFRGNTTGTLSYAINIPEGENGVYGLYVSGRAQSGEKWGLKTVTVTDDAASNSVTYIKKSNTAASIFDDTSDCERSFGAIALNSGNNILTIALSNTRNGGASFLCGIRLIKDEMVDGNGEATIAVNKNTTFVGATVSTESTEDYLAFSKTRSSNKTNDGYISVDVYTKKAGWYALNGDLQGADVTNPYPFYWDDLYVTGAGGTKIKYLDAGSKEVVAANVGETTRKTTEIKKVFLENGKNTITLGLWSDRNANLAYLYGIKLTAYEPVTEITNGTGTVEFVKENMMSCDTGFNNVTIQRFKNTGESRTFYVKADKAGKYNVVFNATYNSGKGNSTSCKITVAIDGKSIEKTYDITGLNNNGDVVCVDLGNIELTGEKQLVTLTGSGATNNLAFNLKNLTFTEYVPFIGSFVLDENTATVTLNKDSKETAIPLQLIVAAYDADGKLISAATESRAADSTTTSLTATVTPVSSDDIRAYLWTDGMKPVDIVKKK